VAQAAADSTPAEVHGFTNVLTSFAGRAIETRDAQDCAQGIWDELRHVAVPHIRARRVASRSCRATSARPSKITSSEACSSTRTCGPIIRTGTE
jgi:hypothetical protein